MKCKILTCVVLLSPVILWIISSNHTGKKNLIEQSKKNGAIIKISFEKKLVLIFIKNMPPKKRARRIEALLKAKIIAIQQIRACVYCFWNKKNTYAGTKKRVALK